MAMSSGCMDLSSCVFTEQQGAGALNNNEEPFCNNCSSPTGPASKLKFIGEKKFQASVEEVFNSLFSDDAILFLERFHTSQGDKSKATILMFWLVRNPGLIISCALNRFPMLTMVIRRRLYLVDPLHFVSTSH
ncbi:hypothetical protein CLOM_g9005 [Closterium sp. NIES-68]|nr:hypothetical protein CLOM_g9005 [Closterium sp. NIES-68]GJP59836.1 hypothetical protein CLOP_g15318 [Closterium sp. NIES-67]